MKPLLVSLLLVFGASTIAQTTISGSVTDSLGQPLPYVSVVLLHDNNFLAGTSTDEAGKFSLAYAIEKGQTYIIKFSVIGYHAYTRVFNYADTSFLQSIILQRDKTAMGTVTITARKSLITRKADRFVVNVENSFLADGNTGLEVLQKSPGIWVDNNGTIRIKGSLPALVMINDVVQRMSGEEMADFLRTLKSEDISKIEIITNPPSEYEAAGSGGIIHIVLKKARKDGLNASANALYRYQGGKPLVSAGSSLNYKNKNWVLTGGYAFAKDDRTIVERSDIIYPDKSFYANYTHRKERMTNHQYRLGVTYDIAPKHSIDIQSIRTHNVFPQDFMSGINIISGTQHTNGINISDKDRIMNYGSVTANYTWRIDTLGSALKVIGDYSYSNKEELDNFLEVYSDTSMNEQYRIDLPFTTNIYSIQSDYTKVLKHKTEFKAGIKYASIKRDNSIDAEDFNGSEWVVNTGQSNRFIYTENLLMVYSSVEKSIQQFIIKAGLRAEETFSIGNSVTANQKFKRNYFGLFPSAFIMYNVDEDKGTAVYINYSRRLTRPSLRDLNPYRIRFSNYTAMTGNPQLQPEYTHNISLGYKFLTNYTAELYITKTENVITISANPGPNNAIDYFSANINSSFEYGVSISAPITIAKIWNISNDFSINQLSYTFLNQKMRQLSFDAGSVHNIAVSKTLNIEAAANYRSPYIVSNLYNPYTFYFDVGGTKKIWKGKGRIRLFISDIFNTLREKEITDYDQTHIVFYRKRQTRGASLSFSYTFSAGKKFNNKQIQQGSSEERGRMGG